MNTCPHLTALTPEQFERSARSPGSAVVDLRESDERVAAGFIRGSILVPRGRLEFVADPTSSSHDSRLHPDREVLLYCTDGGRSALAAVTLQALGFQRVAQLAGGIDAWIAAGHPIEAKFVSPY